jgi:hypothetical protein
MLVLEGDLRERLAFCRRRSDDGPPVHDLANPDGRPYRTNAA